MKKLFKLLLICMIILIPTLVYAEDDFEKLSKKIGSSKAIDQCMTGNEGEYRCYRFTHLPDVHPMYNTTVWSNKEIGCGFELASEWDYKLCKTGSLDLTYEQCKGEYCRNISHSGFSGTPDFYDKRVVKDVDKSCDNLYALHIIYRVITILAPIITILFITFDLVSSIISGDAKKVSKFRSKLLRRIIALLVLIVLPILLHLLISTLSKNQYIKDAVYLRCVVIGSNKDTTITDNTNPKPSKEQPNLITGILIDGKSLDGFKTSTKSYSMNVKNSVSSITIEVNTSDSSVLVTSGDGTHSLKEGTNTIKINATTDGIDYDLITLKVTREKSTSTKTNTNTKTNTTKTTKAVSYGATKGSEVITVKKVKYVAIKTKFPGGLSAQAKSFEKEGISQNANKKYWGSCCYGMARIQACGLSKSSKLTQKSTGLDKLKTKQCGYAVAGCSFSSTYQPYTEKELVQYVIKKIQAGKPVVIRVISKNCAKKKGVCLRHFVTVVGYKEATKGESAKDLLVVDSYDAKLERMDTNNRAIAPCNKVSYKGEGKSKCKGTQYMAFAVK